MFSIRYKNEIVDIQPGQKIEHTRNNPMFLIESLLGEYSTPLTIVASEKNVRLFGEYFFDLSIKKKGKFEVEILDHGSFAFNATLVIETANVNRRVFGKGNASGFILNGISSFLSKIKDKKANKLECGGERVLEYTTNDPTDNSGGYVQHFQQTWDNTFDYIVAPIRNELWTGDPDDELANGWMNILDLNANLMPLQAYVLQPRVKYLLECLFREHGWILDSSAMAGTGWENLFLFSVKPLFTINVTWDQTWVGDRYENIPTATNISELRFKLAEWISPEVTCTDLLLEICKKYGWVPLCSSYSNVCRLVPLKKAKNGRIKDWTKYASATVSADFSGEAKVFEFKNEMPPNDEFLSKPSFENLKIEPPVLSKADLPSPLGNYDNSVIYAFKENQYFRIELDETTNQRVWAVFSDNIYDEEVEGATDTFETKVSTLPVYRTKYRTLSGIDFYGLFPLCKQSRNKDWGLRTLYYHGMVDEVKADGTSGPKKYPYLSSINILPNGTQSGDWSNVLKHDKGDDDFGIIKHWFQAWIDLIGQVETDEQKIYLPIHELYKFEWDDIILIFNIAYLVRSFIEPRGYPGFIQATLQKLSLDKFDAEGAPAPDVYLKMVFENPVFIPLIALSGYTEGITYTDVTEGDWIIYVYADAAGTIPALPSVPLKVYIENVTQADSNPDPSILGGLYDMDTNGDLIVLGNPIILHDMAEATINVPPSYSSHFTRFFRLRPGTGYKIIE